MENFKRENFQAEHPDRAFPRISALSRTEADSLRKTWCGRLRVDNKTGALDLLRLIEESAELASGSAEADNFNLVRMLEASGVQPQETVYVNWRRFDDLDAIALDDLSNFFDYIWYPGADDIEVFDGACSWILVIRHDGVLRVRKF
jgi:hypothetical protein